jgi:hypothetical protein
MSSLYLLHLVYLVLLVAVVAAAVWTAVRTDAE